MGKWLYFLKSLFPQEVQVTEYYIACRYISGLQWDEGKEPLEGARKQLVHKSCSLVSP